MKDTRQRILDTALDLFIEQGFDKTSLREIAERVGVTKAALYYHFASKDEIFRTLMQPMLELQGQAMALLQEQPTLEEWSVGLTTLVDWVLPQRRLFELFENNQNAVRALAEQMIAESDYADVHEAMHERVNAMLTDDAMPLADRVRMAGAVGLVMGVLGFAAGKAFLNMPAEELRPVIVDAINDVLRVGAGRRSPPRPGRADRAAEGLLHRQGRLSRRPRPARERLLQRPRRQPLVGAGDHGPCGLKPPADSGSVAPWPGLRSRPDEFATRREPHMAILLDSASLADAAAAAELGFVGGITTNPALMARETSDPLAQLERLLTAFPAGPLCFQPIGDTASEMVDQARAAVALSPQRVVVKLPATLEALRAATALRAEGCHCALTAVYTPAQALLADEVGCKWIIPYVDRAARQSVGGLIVIDALAAMLTALHSDTRILAASLKSSQQVVDSILHGAHDMTAPLDVLTGLAAHPLTESAVAEFAAAAAKAKAGDPVKPSLVARGVYQIGLRGVNVFLIEAGDDLVLIDAALKGSPPRLTEAIYSLGRLPQEVTAIIVTHAHPDHIGGLAEMKRRTGAEVWMHPADAELVARGVYGRRLRRRPQPRHRLL